MKLLEFVGHQGDVLLYEIDEFPEGEKYQDDLTKKGQLALGELSGHNHYFDDSSAVDLFKLKDHEGLSFFETKKESKLIHGLIKGFKGKETDKDYHNETTLKSGKKYISAIVEETDWITGVIKRVLD